MLQDAASEQCCGLNQQLPWPLLLVGVRKPAARSISCNNSGALAICNETIQRKLSVLGLSFRPLSPMKRFSIR
jgi:hypothetical protein